ncbi:MAG: S8 family serine peptidase [Chloroflexi bacterium]|nr:S8 family serine peptidase [Chloroflexota bacterium]
MKILHERGRSLVKRTTAGGVALLAVASLIAGPSLVNGNVQREAPLRMAPAERGVAGRYIVVLRGDRAARAKANSARAMAGVQIRHVYENSVRGFSAQLTDAALAQLRTDPDVAYIEQDQVVHTVDSQTNPPWGLDRIDQPALPLDESYTYDVEGAGVNVYIIDTGIRSTHSEFTGRVGDGYDVVDGGAPDDCNGHGTHVAGTIGGTTYGVAKQVTLHAVRVLDCEGSGYDSDVIAGIDWVTANHVKPAVANMSLGGDASDALDEAMRKSVDAGVVHVVAAGNENDDACDGSPAREPSALTIGATDDSDERAWFSNYGTCLDLFAPGMDILSAWYSGDSEVAELSGTSMASPHVAGAAALYLARFPAASPAEVAAALTDAAASGVVSDAQSGSPNLLLQIGATTPPVSPTPGPSPTPEPTTTPAAPVAFDDIGAAKEISGWPYSDVEDTSAATTASDDPVLCSSLWGGASVWYRFTPTETGWLTMDTIGSEYDTILAVFSGAPGDLTPVPNACNDDSSDLQSQVELQINAGQTYYVEVTDFQWDSAERAHKAKRAAARASAGGLLHLNASFTNDVPVTPTPPTPTPSIEPTVDPSPSETPDPNDTDPIVNDVTPRVGMVDQATQLIINGADFTNPMSVTLGDVPLSSIYFGDENWIYGQAPQGMAPGTYTLHVCNSANRCSSLEDVYTVMEGGTSVLESVSPNRTFSGTQADVSFYGYNFTSGVSITIGGLPVEEMEVADSNTIDAITPANLPVGVHDVELTYGAGGTSTLYKAFTVMADDTDDWFATEEDLWSSPSMVRSGDTVQIGLNVHRIGGERTQQVDVSFYQMVDGVPQLIDRVLAPPMMPGTESIDTASTMWTVSGVTDTVTIMAVIDVDGQISDLNRENNIVTHTISILPPAQDETAPQVSSFSVNEGAAETADRQVALSIGVTGTTSSMYIIERAFSTAAGLWIPVQSTGWISYQSTYVLTLTGESGVRYLQVWAGDSSGNISSNSGFEGINYNPAPANVAQDEVRMFRYQVSAGQTVTATLETLSGDADLYVWNPDGSLAGWDIRAGTATDQVIFTATSSGEHQIEVYGYESAQYRLTVDYGAGAARTVHDVSARPSAKTVRSSPVVRPGSLPAGSISLPSAPIGSAPASPVVLHFVYVPVIN